MSRKGLLAIIGVLVLIVAAVSGGIFLNRSEEPVPLETDAVATSSTRESTTVADVQAALSEAEDPEYEASLLAKLGLELTYVEDYQGAISKYEEAIELYPTADYYLQLAGVHLMAGDRPAAEGIRPRLVDYYVSPSANEYIDQSVALENYDQLMLPAEEGVADGQ